MEEGYGFYFQYGETLGWIQRRAPSGTVPTGSRGNSLLVTGPEEHGYNIALEAKAPETWMFHPGAFPGHFRPKCTRKSTYLIDLLE